MRLKDLNHNRRRRGQSLVEAALVTFAFLMILIGILDVGQVLFVHQTLVERSRAALRYGAVRDFDADAIRNMVLYNSPTAPGREGNDGNDNDIEVPGIFGLVASHVQVSRTDATLAGDRIVVRIIDYPFRFYTPLISGLYEGKDIVASIPYEVVN